LNFLDALEVELARRNDPIVTEYDFYRLGADVFHAEAYETQPLKRKPEAWDVGRSRNAMRRLVRPRKTLIQDSDFGTGVWRVLRSTRTGSAEEVACIADPFCYVSHLSAMQRFGLTDRSPQALHLTTPARAIWADLRSKRVARDYPNPIDEPPPLLHIRFRDTLRHRPVVVHESSHPATPIEVRGERTRISSIGRTFVDMLAEPALCGGIRHVLEIWAREASEWRDDIIRAVDQYEVKLVKVRAGYVLSERLGLSDPRVDAWVAFAQRGGSQKLDPDAAYAPDYSERWMISLNV
jgi:predicted transcriptional regulator of viral defense system